MELADKIKTLRKQQDLTLLEIAIKMDVSEATVQRWESGNIKSMRHGRIVKLARVLDTSPAYLMGWEDAPEKNDVCNSDTLTHPEQALINRYRQLNQEGKEKLDEYAEDLTSLNRYKKHDFNNVSKQA